MRQLKREGWIDNRTRFVVGSFLTKDLGIDWRWGERWFIRLLLDGDEANNNGNWQWIASVGVDPQPVSRRILNPALQLKKYDPDGTYVRRYVPELTETPYRLPATDRRPRASQTRGVGPILGSDQIARGRRRFAPPAPSSTYPSWSEIA
jgi:deoxyribodipyrimidine photo-lyase